MKKSKVELFDYDPCVVLNTEDKMIAYLNAELADGDPFYIKEALKLVASKYDLNDLARKAGISQETINNSLSADVDPPFSTMQKIITALDMRLSVVTVFK